MRWLCPAPSKTFRRFWNSPPVTPEQVAELNEEITQQLRRLPKLRELKPVRRARKSVGAQLYLSEDPIATLYFVYNGLPVYSRSLRDDMTHVRILADNKLRTKSRRIAKRERQIQQRFDTALADSSHGRDFWLAFVLDGIAKLRSEGWDVVINDDFPYRLASAGDWYVDADSGRDREWFDLKLGLVVDGVQINLLPALVDYLQGALGTGEAGVHRIGDQLFVQLPDKRYLPVPIDRIKRIADTLVELFDHDALNKQQSLSLPASQASRLAQLTSEPEAPVLRSKNAALLESVAELKNFSAIDAAATAAELQRNVASVSARRPGLAAVPATLPPRRHPRGRHGLGQNRADAGPSRAGKGRRPADQAVAHRRAGERHRQLAARDSAVRAAFETTDVAWLATQGAVRSIRNVDIVITAYPLLQLDSEVLTAHEFYLVVMDEAQVIKNPRAKVSQAARALQRRASAAVSPARRWRIISASCGRSSTSCNPACSATNATSNASIGQPSRRTTIATVPCHSAGASLRSCCDGRRMPSRPSCPRRRRSSKRSRSMRSSATSTTACASRSHRRVRETIEERGLARSQITVLDALAQAASGLLRSATGRLGGAA